MINLFSIIVGGIAAWYVFGDEKGPDTGDEKGPDTITNPDEIKVEEKSKRKRKRKK